MVNKRDSKRDPIMRAVFAKRGFAFVIARRLNLTHQTVSAWNRVPAQYVLDLVPVLNMPPEKIRPDIFGKKRVRR